MKCMKKLIFAVLLPILYCVASFLSPPLHSAHAVSDCFAYVPTQNVYFYTSESNGVRQGLFLLPYSYYVHVVGEDEEYYLIEYLTDGTYTKKLFGYCKKSEVIPVDYLPERPYLYLTVDVTYTINGGMNPSFSEITFTCGYYGDYLEGTKTFAYVYRDDLFGYIPKPTTLTYPKNEEYDERNKAEDVFAEEKSSSPSQIALLVLLCLLIPTVATLILKPNKKNFDEED